VVSIVMYRSQQRPYLDGGVPVASSSSLLSQVLGITGAGFVVTAATGYLARGFPYGASLVAMLVGFGFLIAISGTRRNPGLSMLMFYAFTACEGIGIGPIVATYARIDGSAVVVNAASTTGLGMLALGGIVALTSFDYRRLSGIAFGALIALVLVGLISAFTHFLHPQVYSWLTLVVFTLLVLVDFARIRAGGAGATAIQLATSIYLDAINIFLALLRIFGAGNRD
ncbi:MAG: Bax inhibitor-1 family protein, partial [Candidatus Eremiobacteraeota bacterium]|nr:Bax inhibitor-1 family protein [Candidatus Eremiobacteraeota bacterium]